MPELIISLVGNNRNGYDSLVRPWQDHSQVAIFAGKSAVKEALDTSTPVVIVSNPDYEGFWMVDATIPHVVIEVYDPMGKRRWGTTPKKQLELLDRATQTIDIELGLPDEAHNALREIIGTEAAERGIQLAEFENAVA